MDARALDGPDVHPVGAQRHCCDLFFAATRPDGSPPVWHV